MRQIIPLVTVICCLWNSAVSNPILNPYDEIGITEVYIVSPEEWYIELDGTWLLFDMESQYGPEPEDFPCSTDVYLWFRENPAQQDIYRARVRFEQPVVPKSGYNVIRPGVITRSSLKPDEGEKISREIMYFSNSGVVMVTNDTSEEATAESSERYWSFPLQECPEGNSLIAVGSGYKQQIYSTSRRSIGSPGNYSTLYEITLLDMHGIPLGNISASSRRRYSNYSGSSDNTGLCTLSMEIYDPDTIVHFRDYFTLHPDERVEVASLPVGYVDEDTLIETTVKIPVTQYMLRVEGTDHIPAYNSIRPYKIHRDSSFPDEIVLWYGSGSEIIVNPLRVYESYPSEVLCFADYNASVASVMSGIDNCLGTWSRGYIDTAAIIHETVTVATTALSRATGNNGTPPSGVTIAAFSGNCREVRAVISSAQSSVHGNIALYTVNGREVGAQPVEMRGSGTGSVLFRFPEEKLSPGMYCFILSIDGHAPVSRRITLY